jgi:O-antigen chain-terminating methyltransferase
VDLRLKEESHEEERMPKRGKPQTDSSSNTKTTRRASSPVADRLERLRKKAKTGETRLDDLHRVIVEMTEELAARIKNLYEEFASVRKYVAALEQRLQKLDVESVSEIRCNEMRNDVESQLSQLSDAVKDLRSLSVLSANDFSYFRFENLHRGPPEHVIASLTPYVDYFERCQRVVDLGCGRGEFLDLCQARGIGIYGVDSNEDMVLHCEGRGLNVISADIVEHLKSLPERWLDGVFCSQVIEHLPLSQLQELFKESARVLKAGARIVIATINPGSVFTLANNFFLDPTHVRPLPAGTAKFLAEEAGFRDLDIQYRAPFGADYSLLPVVVEDETEWQRALRINFERLNHIVLGYQEYVLVGLK